MVEKLIYDEIFNDNHVERKHMAYSLRWISLLTRNDRVGLLSPLEELKHLVAPRSHDGGGKSRMFAWGRCKKNCPNERFELEVGTLTNTLLVSSMLCEVVRIATEKKCIPYCNLKLKLK
jgi:hypothetical protein